MLDEMRGLLHEMRHAGAVPGESPGAALTGVTTPRMILVTDIGTPAEPALVALAVPVAGPGPSRRRQRPTIPEAVPPLRRRRRWMCRRQAVPPPALSALRVDRRTGGLCGGPTAGGKRCAAAGLTQRAAAQWGC